MNGDWAESYKGYKISVHASWSQGTPYGAHFFVTEEGASGDQIIHEGHLQETFATDEEAWAAARSAGKAFIDKL